MKLEKKSPSYWLLAYIIIAIIYVYYVQFDWIVSGDGYAETITNYYRVAHSKSGFFEQIFSTDYGYTTPILRIIPYLCSLLNLQPKNELITYNFFAVLLSILMPAIIFHDRYSVLINCKILKFIFALFFFCFLNFESRMYHNISVIFSISLFIILFTVIKTNHITKSEKFIILLFVMGKPFGITLLIPLLALIFFKKINRLYFSFICILILYQFVNILLNSSNEITRDWFEDISNIFLLFPYNFLKLFSFGLGPLLLKVYSTNYFIIIILTVLVGAIFFTTCLMRNKNFVKRNYIFTIQLLVNILWTLMLVLGTRNFSFIDNNISVDFNRYDIITVFNLLCFFILRDFYILVLNKKFFFSTCILLLVYSSASIFQYKSMIMNNLYYIGSSTWAFHNNSYDGSCSLLSPLGIGNGCVIYTNINNRNETPYVKLINKKVSVEINANISLGKVIIFEDDNTNINKPILYFENITNKAPTSVNLFNNRRALIYDVNCSISKRCILEFEFINNRIFHNNDNSLLIAWY